jgi:5-methylcytosine-specific restriction endonuclease McrA
MKKPDREFKRASKHVTRGPRWLALRHAVLERDGWACVQCGARGVRIEVDHIRPVRTHPGAAYDPSNLQSLCAPCHSRKTNLEMGRGLVSEARQKWRDSVSAMMRRGRIEIRHMEKKDA